jgi:hypothetical protein
MRLAVTLRIFSRLAFEVMPRALNDRKERGSVLSTLEIESVCFITAGPITKLFAWRGEESGGHVL